ncbi:MAG: glycosyltransferase family 2 protein [Parcubacteria group bacterium]|nr:glycosyltransferase family 2 protein [Parcubacteria group bacterium]
MNIPKVSILLPTHNGAKWIGGAIESVLGQSFSDFELIVIDDASKDTVADIIKKYVTKDQRVVYTKNEINLGIQKTLNKGSGLAKGIYIARIDDDDTWSEKDKLTMQVDFLDTNIDYVLVGTGTVVVNEKGEELFRFLSPETDGDVRRKILFRNCFTHSSVMFRKREALELGGYGEDEVTRHVEDYELWLRLGSIGKLGNIQSYAVRFTMREGAISARHKKTQLINSVSLITMHKNYYHSYLPALVFAHCRCFGYSIVTQLPQSFQGMIFGMYKKL